MLCVWETEFDYADAELKALAAKEWQQISEWDLSAYYVLNLVYNEPMQIELFRYLFPLCLAQWHENVLAGGYGDHFEESLMKALCRPYLWQEMMNASQRQQVRQFSSWLVSSLISPNHKSSVTRPSSSNKRWQPGKGIGHCA